LTNLGQFFASYKRGASLRGHIFELTLDEFEQLVRRPCWYCGRYNRGEIFSGVDRIDSSCGYVRTNVLPCCGECNLMKGSLSKDAFLASIVRIARHLENK